MRRTIPKTKHQIVEVFVNQQVSVQSQTAQKHHDDDDDDGITRDGQVKWREETDCWRDRIRSTTTAYNE